MIRKFYSAIETLKRGHVTVTQETNKALDLNLLSENWGDRCSM